MRHFIFAFGFFIAQVCTFAQACPSSGLEIREVRASETDSNIGFELLKHQIFVNTDCPSNGKLLLHMVGTYDSPSSTTFYPSLAANNGFKAISLKYPNLDSAFELCRENIDEACFLRFHQEVVYGIDSELDIDVNEDECIYNRILKLLIHLNEEYPSEGWSEFLLNGNEINWSRITLSGHSQGGGHAAYLGKLNKVDRVINFASPNEISLAYDRPAPWLSDLGLTPAEDYYAFANIYDDVVDFSEQYRCWEALGMSLQGDTLNVDDELCPYLGRSMLYTRYESFVGVKPNHSLMIIDSFTPLEENIPVFLPVWEYLLGICTISNVSNVLDKTLVVNVYPNPVNDVITIESQEEINLVELMTAQGIVIKKIQPNVPEFQIELGEYSGLIFLRLRGASNKVKLLKLIVQQ